MTDAARDQRRQAHFSQAYLGLARQGFDRARETICPQAGWFCVLLNHSGKRCAVGHVVTDAVPGATTSPEADALLGGTDGEFYWGLRWAHDKAPCPGRMRAALLAVASGYGLALPYGPVQPC